MAPVVTLAHRPVADAARRQRTVELAERTAARGRTGSRPRTSFGGAWISPTCGLASIRSSSVTMLRPDIRLSASRTEHVGIGAAPANEEVLDVAALATVVVHRAAVVDPLAARHALAARLPGLDLGQPRSGSVVSLSTNRSNRDDLRSAGSGPPTSPGGRRTPVADPRCRSA